MFCLKHIWKAILLTSVFFIRDEVHETNAEVHRELNKVVSKRAIEPNEESLRKKSKTIGW